MVYFVLIGGGFLIAGFARRRITEPFLGLSLAVLVVILISWLVRPRATLYVTIFLTAVSDIATVSWFPFVKNFSSRESISFIADSLTISPLDVSLVVGFGVTAIDQYARTRRLLPPSQLTRPILVFTAFVVLGFLNGVFAAGGDVRIAVLEARPLFYLLLTFGIVINLCTQPHHLRHALWWTLAGVTVQSLLSLEFYGRLDPAQRDALESLNEHGSTLGHNLVIITLLGLLLLRAHALVARVALLIAMAPTIFIVFVAQRRAGIAALAIAGVLALTVLFWRRRSKFWVVAPIVTIVTLGYLGAFWSSTSAVAFPAQAIKSIVAPSSASTQDQNSDLYRLAEAFDLNYTIRTAPVTGIGFGRAFYRPVPLPDITFFELNAFVPHNSILWIWLKTGFFGFAAMFYLFAKAIVLGAQSVRRMADGIDVVVAQTGLLFVVMYVAYTYVDISWDARNMVFLGLAFAICAHPLASHRRSTSADDEPQVEAAHAVDSRRSDTTSATNRA